eukprot:5098327-Prymnesium_polylepis.1
MLMRSHGRRALMSALGAHAFAHPPSARSGDLRPAPRACAPCKDPASLGSILARWAIPQFGCGHSDSF